MDGQGTKCRRNIAENLNRLSTAHERHRQQTDGRAIAYSEPEREFTFAKNHQPFYHTPLKNLTLERCNPWPHVANRHISTSPLLSL